MSSPSTSWTSGQRLYFDHAATTALRPEVVEAMRPYFSGEFGNPSSLHSEGRVAGEALEAARHSILSTLRAAQFDLVFTSGGTESDHAAVVGCVLGCQEQRGGRKGEALSVIASAVEHSALLGTEDALERLGSRLVRASVNGEGRVHLGELDACLDSSTCLISVMAANNETGALQPLDALSRLARKRGIPFHTDAVQLLGKLSPRLDTLAVDLVSLSAHKIYGPKGVGALLVRRGTPFRPLLRGGMQEQGWRAGTQNVAGAVGLARAVELAEEERPREAGRLASMLELLREGIHACFGEAVVFNTPKTEALASILNVSFPQVEGESLVTALDHLGVAVSTGSACNSGGRKPSHVLRAMGRSDREVRGSLRISLGRGNQAEEIPVLLARIEEAVSRLASLAPTA